MHTLKGLGAAPDQHSRVQDRDVAQIVLQMYSGPPIARCNAAGESRIALPTATSDLDQWNNGQERSSLTR